MPSRFYEWVIRSRLEPITKVARMLKRHWGGVINAVLTTVWKRSRLRQPASKPSTRNPQTSRDCVLTISRPTIRSVGCLEDQHRIAVATKAVAAGDSLAVGIEHTLAADERGDEHQQRRTRQVEVRDQAAH